MTAGGGIAAGVPQAARSPAGAGGRGQELAALVREHSSGSCLEQSAAGWNMSKYWGYCLSGQVQGQKKSVRCQKEEEGR